MHTEVLPIEGTHTVQQGDTSPAIVVLSPSLVVLYANRGGTAVLQELKDEIDRSRIVLLFSDKPTRCDLPEQRKLLLASSNPLPLLSAPVLETSFM